MIVRRSSGASLDGGPGYGAGMSDSPPVDHREPVVVATYLDLGEAEIAQAKLRAFGIEAEILDQAEGGVIPTIELPVGIGVSVRAVDADDAFRILSDTTEV